jgi:hypothetical protein
MGSTSVLKTDLESLLRKISDETELILNDNLARGELVSVANVSAVPTKEPNLWHFGADATLSPSLLVEYPEFWGDTTLYFSLLTRAQKYPWMPVQVSEFDPF